MAKKHSKYNQTIDSLLSREDVASIRLLSDVPHAIVASEYGVSAACIASVRRGESTTPWFEDDGEPEELCFD